MEEFGADRIKHLEFIQAAIARLANTSSIIKGWTITVTTALFAAAVARASWQMCLITLLPVVVFWLLDSHFLQRERAYRKLYDVASRSVAVVEVFSMDSREYRDSVKLKDSALSSTLVLMYGGLVVLSLAMCVSIGLSR